MRRIGSCRNFFSEFPSPVPEIFPGVHFAMKLAAIAVPALLALPVFAAPAFAQTADLTPAPPAGGMHRGPGGPGFGREGLHTAVAPVTSAPLTAKYTSTSSFTTREGKSVERDGSTSVYRDSLGRTREDVTLPPPPHPREASSTTSATAPAPGTPRTMTVILDPVANTVTRLLAEQKVAVVETVPADFFQHAISREAREAAGPHARGNSTVTSLGSKMFAGISATGTRTTFTFPPREDSSTATSATAASTAATSTASTPASTAPVTMTHETWFSPDLKLEVSSTETGVHGTSTNTLTTLTRAEPDASLFKVPEGYTVKAATPHDRHGRGPGGPPSDAPPSGF